MINIDEHQNFKQLLQKAISMKESIFIILNNGKEYFGRIGKVDDSFFTIKKISGKEYYDAMVRLDLISVIEVRNIDDGI